MHTESRTFTVRLAIERPDCSMATTYQGIRAQDADHAAALAIRDAEKDTGKSGWVLDGPVEDGAIEQLDAAIEMAARRMVDARRASDAAAEQYNDLVRRKVRWERES